MVKLTPSQKGAAAEAAITSAVIQLGLVALRPLCEGSRYDLVVDLEPQLLRVQCKFARRVGGVLVINLQTPVTHRTATFAVATHRARSMRSPPTHRNFVRAI
jgi:hypothetical protein